MNKTIALTRKMVKEGVIDAKTKERITFDRIIVPDELETSECKDLYIPTSIIIDGETYDIVSLDNDLFKGRDDYTGKLILPEKLTHIGKIVFGWCTNLTGTLELPKTTTHIGAHAFSNCYGFTGKLVLPNDLVAIESLAFDDCIGITELILPEKLRNIGSYAFHNCINLTSIVSTCQNPLYKHVVEFCIKGNISVRNGSSSDIKVFLDDSKQSIPVAVNDNVMECKTNGNTRFAAIQKGFSGYGDTADEADKALKKRMEQYKYLDKMRARHRAETICGQKAKLKLEKTLKFGLNSPEELVEYLFTFYEQRKDLTNWDIVSPVKEKVQTFFPDVKLK